MSKLRKRFFAVTTSMISFAMLVFLSGLAIAGDINPPASPAPTMHTLDEIYNQSSPLPNPDDVTIITKALNPSTFNTWETIHTVSSGKSPRQEQCSQ